MRGMANAMAAYAQPLLDECDGKKEDIESAFMMAQICWNLAVAPDDDFPVLLIGFQKKLEMNDDVFAEFLSDIILPMIVRHHEMFPHMHGQSGMDAFEPPSLRKQEGSSPVMTALYPGTPLNAPCPCNSGKKYKSCCGQVH